MNRRKLRIGRVEDFLSGVLFFLLGVGALIVGSAYPMGTATRMGPGYLPVVLSSILLILGLLIMIRSLSFSSDEPAEANKTASEINQSLLAFLKPLVFISAALIAFGILLPKFGLVVAVITLVIVSSFADYRNHFLLSLPLSVVLAFAVVMIFVKGLGLPIPIWPR